MSVKMMTTDQLNNDLASIHNMWNGGVPPEQQDRVNALRAELKRRGADIAPIVPGVVPQKHGIEVMSDEQLTKELRDIGERIGKNPGDEKLQEQFANVRFELRKRANQQAAMNQFAQTAEQPPARAFDPVTGEPKVVAAFDPVTGETFKEQLANGNGHAKHLLGQIPPSEERMNQLKVEFLEKQAASQRAAEEMMRKHIVAQLAAKVTGSLLIKFSDPNGDDIENACVIGIQVAQNIILKVGL